MLTRVHLDPAAAELGGEHPLDGRVPGRSRLDAGDRVAPVSTRSACDFGSRSRPCDASQRRTSSARPLPPRAGRQRQVARPGRTSAPPGQSAADAALLLAGRLAGRRGLSRDPRRREGVREAGTARTAIRRIGAGTLGRAYCGSSALMQSVPESPCRHARRRLEQRGALRRQWLRSATGPAHRPSPPRRTRATGSGTPTRPRRGPDRRGAAGPRRRAR